MTGTDLCVNKPHLSRSYLNHLVHGLGWHGSGWKQATGSCKFGRERSSCTHCGTFIYWVKKVSIRR
jgi:hypothetical protein